MKIVIKFASAADDDVVFETDNSSDQSFTVCKELALQYLNGMDMMCIAGIEVED